jgi:hypothetical protein
MLSALLDIVFIVALVVGIVNRPKPWGRRVAFGVAAIVVIVYASVPTLRHRVVQQFLEGFNEAIVK